MATNWPNSVQTFTNPTASSALNSPSHADQHTTVNDTVEALQQYAGMVLVKTQAVGSGVSSVTVTNAFDSRFENYRVVYWVTASVNSLVEMSISGETSATGYDSKLFYSSVYSAAAWTDVLRGAADAWIIGYTNASVTASGSVEVYRPYANLRARFSSQFSSYVSGVANGATVASSGTQSTGFTLAPSSGTFSGGTIRVYGYNNG
jgi:hypothetical protein